ncbi:hypothetical protein IG631_11949 [Alternaria alternata]|jgi:hypothetical protein|nr:hypothetical protein IG631_11949 [Alternaria alternata]
MRSGRWISSKAQLCNVSPVLACRMLHPQCKSIVPAGGEVANFDFIVAGRLPLTPQQQTLLRTETLLVDVADGESQNEGPYQTQDDLAVTIDDVLGTGIGKLDPPASDEVERLVDVLKLLHPQLGSGGIAAEGLVTENLKEVYEYDLRGRQ